MKNQMLGKQTGRTIFICMKMKFLRFGFERHYYKVTFHLQSSPVYRRNETDRSGLNSELGLSGMSCATNKVDLADKVVENLRWGWLIKTFELLVKSIERVTVVGDLFWRTTDVRLGVS